MDVKPKALSISRQRVFNYAIILLFMFIIGPGSFFVRADEQDNAETPKTGSWQNCTDAFQRRSDNRRLQAVQTLDANSIADKHQHPDSGVITISCTKINYRVPRKSINKIIENEVLEEAIVIGVLSGAGGEGPSKRNSIRSTWAYRKQNVFFIVAGPWDQIQHEYNRFHDLLWIDREEVYVTETSVLTFKTESFISVMYNEFMKGGDIDHNGDDNDNHTSILYLFKADDDSYVDLQKLYRALMIESKNHNYSWDYWGKCNYGWKPHRETSNKWYISPQVYPEPEYPPFCQGAGIAMSKKFLDCAVGSGHISQIRYQPNEDVAIGMLAERCGVQPIHDDRVLIRYDEEELTMHKKIVQHYVKTEEAMRLHHKCVTGVKGPRIV